MASTGAVPAGFVSRAPRLGFVGGFDGVRGIGILMVLMNHAYSNLSPSFAGIIDVFFVMSAFLIVTLLMQEYRDHSGINMRKFYARRAVRLLPSAYLCILAWIVYCLIFDRERLIWVLQDAAAAVTGADIAHLGLEGPAFGEALRKARIAAIGAARTLHRDAG